jgi:hypothetical protein
MAKGSSTIFYFFLIAFSIVPFKMWKAGFLILESVQAWWGESDNDADDANNDNDDSQSVEAASTPDLTLCQLLCVFW